MCKNLNPKTCVIVIGLLTGLFASSVHASSNLSGATLMSKHSSLKVNQDKVDKEIEKVANNQFKKAKEKYKEKLYSQSIIDLIVILDYYPDFSKLDELLYLLGSCLYEMEVFDGADLMYRYLLKKIPQTPLVPDVILALQKVYYHKNEYQQSLKFYNALEGHYSFHQVVDESRYYAGQAYYHLKNYNIVPSIIQQIKNDSEFYSFSLYTGGLIYLKKKDVKNSVDNFIKITKLSAKSPEEQDLIESARLSLGYILFELASYEAAVNYLEDISSEFYDYPEVLLAIGWSTYKLQDYQSAIIALNDIVVRYPNFYNNVEAHFLLGQCYLKLGYFDFSINEFTEIIKPVSDAQNFSSSIYEIRREISGQEKQIEKLKTELMVLESKLLNVISTNSGNDIPEDIAKERKKINKEHNDLIQKIVKESPVLADASNKTKQLKTQIEKIEMQKNWQSYAEYGKVRALYLRGIKE